MRDKIIETWTKNIEFMRDRIRIQNEEGYDQWAGHVNGERQYTEFDIEMEQAKIDRASRLSD